MKQIEFDIQGNYGQGYETVTCEETRAEALRRLKEYRENEPGISFRLVRKTIRAADKD